MLFFNIISSFLLFSLLMDDFLDFIFVKHLTTRHKAYEYEQRNIQTKENKNLYH